MMKYWFLLLRWKDIITINKEKFFKCIRQDL